MAPTPLQHRRTHNTLLFQKLLNLRDGASPFTLILDSLSQSGGVVIREFIGRAKISKSKILFISYATLRKRCPVGVDIYISTRGKSLSDLRREIISHFPTDSTSNTSPQKLLIIIDSLNPLSSSHPQHLSTFLSSLLLNPSISLLGTYHSDIPLSPPHQQQSPQSNLDIYNPSPLTTLTYLATAILYLQNLSQVLSRKRAQDRSLPAPVWGLEEGREGVLVGLMHPSPQTQNNPQSQNLKLKEVVIEMEIRRKSGRGVIERFIFSPSMAKVGFKPAAVALLEEHPLYLPQVDGEGKGKGEGEGTGEELTFSLGLTEKQRVDREGVVLPYFDAQKDGGMVGPGEGGRILYEMGEEDKEDFDDEEDEI